VLVRLDQVPSCVFGIRIIDSTYPGFNSTTVKNTDPVKEGTTKVLLDSLLTERRETDPDQEEHKSVNIVNIWSCQGMKMGTL